MKAVDIASLKARLSHYLRAVRGGETITVLDRQTPVATLAPYESRSGALRVRPPVPGARQPRELQPPPPVPLDRDIVEVLLEDRGSGR